jgi:apolipoprotein N-acyltransferase
MLVLVLANELWPPPPPAPGAATAVLLQDNLTVDENNQWLGEVVDPATHQRVPQWDRNIARYSDASRQSCTPFYVGVQQAGAMYVANPQCPVNNIALIAWPEAPSPFRSWDPRFFFAVAGLAQSTHAAVIAGNIAREPVTIHGRMEIGEFNAASVWAADGHLEGVYAKIHLVPFAEYVPLGSVFFFARHLTQQAGDFKSGTARLVLATGDGHQFGVFICYESIFADEVRRFAKSGAEVLVNISDDEWFGDTSAPWQHLNMARMRAIENRRWLLRDTNSGVTAAIDPYGRVTQSAQRHVFTSLAVRYGYVSRRTVYTMFGDVFAYLCVLVVLAAVAKVYEPRWKEYQARKKAAAEPPLV